MRTNFIITIKGKNITAYNSPILVRLIDLRQEEVDRIT